ncbi:hydantoinase/oxoprolinase family protein [Mesobacterium pallidum]|uniref:hydantoinase/oxoprolinase family protein n=1 Tax=Mesobacterium pallidum TaxID=2872037 RepID=UPI001EE3778E|nr:hydantoinase/oxoprolinase family protein [Mesobacterium pallidum]
MTGYRIAADIGGTFTDLACLAPDGRLSTRKVPSTPEDYATAIVEATAELAATEGAGGLRFDEVLHASTVATNAILESKGARTALITTRGFRDVLELRRIRVPRLYEPLYEKPAPLVPRRRRYELTERIDARGNVLVPLDADELETLIDTIAGAEVDAVAVCFLHAHVNPAHEAQVAERLRARLPGAFISVSSEVLPEIREYERTSTTVANAYIGPVVARYLRSLSDRLRAAGQDGPLKMMQSSGGVQQIETIIAKPATVVESGPAAGVVGAARMGALAGYGDIITFDMGGTTAKAAMIEGGRISSTSEYEVGGGISLSSQLVKGGGYALKLPVIDVSEVGAGGGSIVRIDAAGALRVGPDSAGSVPGPLCYGKGGTEPTVTDANVVLGYLNPTSLAGGTVPVDAEAARRAFAEDIAPHLGADVHAAAYGVHQLANVTMMRAVKAVSTYRGRDPRDFTLFCFGGNGGVHGAMIARELEMSRVVVPPAAGVYSAVGLLWADAEASRSRAFLAPLDGASLTRAEVALAAMEDEVRAELDDPKASYHWSADLRYAGQAFELAVDLPRGTALAEGLGAIRAAFESEHLRTYGHLLDDKRVQIVTLRVRGAIAAPVPGSMTLAARSPAAPGQTRPVWFGDAHGLCDTPVIGRGELTDSPRQGPAIVEEYEGTTVVPPEATVRRDQFDNIVIDFAQEGRT